MFCGMIVAVTLAEIRFFSCQTFMIQEGGQGMCNWKDSCQKLLRHPCFNRVAAINKIIMTICTECEFGYEKKPDEKA